jgi:hypothetical protein
MNDLDLQAGWAGTSNLYLLASEVLRLSVDLGGR